MLGLPLGLACSFIVSGFVAAEHGWQAALKVAGIPGVLLAVAALFMHEPTRVDRSSPSNALPFVAVARRVLAIPTMWWIILSGALHNFNLYALGTFISSYLTRYHGLPVEKAGTISGIAYGWRRVRDVRGGLARGLGFSP